MVKYSWGDKVADNFRKTKLERFVRQLEARAAVHSQASFGSHGYGRFEAMKEIIADLKHEFKLEGEEK